MTMRHSAAAGFVLMMWIGLTCSCGPREPRTTVVLRPSEAPEVPAGAPTEARRLRELAVDVQTPRDAYAEAEALRRLRRYMSSHDMTYTMRAFRVDADTPVASPSTATTAVRVVVEIFQQQQPMYTFEFVPRDNRNLALLGE